MDGYIAVERARAGEIVTKGSILARLDDRDLFIQRLRAFTEKNSQFTKYNRALVARERAKARIIKSEIARAEV